MLPESKTVLLITTKLCSSHIFYMDTSYFFTILMPTAAHLGNGDFSPCRMGAGLIHWVSLSAEQAVNKGSLPGAMKRQAGGGAQPREYSP